MILKSSKILKIIFSLSLLSNSFLPNSFNNLYSSQKNTNNEELKLVNNKSENFEDKNIININYLNSRGELKDYIIDSEDTLRLEFYPASELNGLFTVNGEGEIILPKLHETYVRGLTIKDLSSLLEKRYAEYLINPEIRVNIEEFRPIRIQITGEVNNPGFYIFNYGKSNINAKEVRLKLGRDFEENIIQEKNITQKEEIVQENINDNKVTISDLISKANGITSYSDLSNIEVIRKIPISYGGGKKRAFVDFSGYLNDGDQSNNIRLRDDDRVRIPSLSYSNKDQIPKSILSGLTPKLITISITGKVETPGNITLPLDSTLSDVIDLTGPRKPLSGKILLIRYTENGQKIRQDIPYSSTAERGSKSNPYVKEGDLIAVKDSLFGKSAGFLKEITAPFVGIYTTKELIEDF